MDLSTDSRKGRMRHVACILGFDSGRSTVCCTSWRFTSKKSGFSLAPFEQVEPDGWVCFNSKKVILR